MKVIHQPDFVYSRYWKITVVMVHERQESGKRMVWWIPTSLSGGQTKTVSYTSAAMLDTLSMMAGAIYE